jgi:hypothetical protein
LFEDVSRQSTIGGWRQNVGGKRMTQKYGEKQQSPHEKHCFMLLN